MKQQETISSPYEEENIGDNIRRWRKVKGIKQHAFAKSIGISKGTLSKIENDKISITAGTLQKAAETLNLQVRILLIHPKHIFGE